MTLPSDLDLVNLCAQIYHGPSSWSHYDNGPDDGVVWALQKLDNCDVVVFRGSITAHDWVEDFRAMPLKTPAIGTVHSGFYDGMQKMLGDLLPMLTSPVFVTGHSLGAARADILCAMLTAIRWPVARRAVFGEPRPGLADFAALLKGIPGNGYRNADKNGHDFVTDVPLRLEGDFHFTHPKPLVDVTASPTGDFYVRHEPFAYHHIELYQAAVAAMLKEPAVA